MVYVEYSRLVDHDTHNLVVIVEEKVVAKAAVGNTHTTVAGVACPRTAAAAQVVVDGLDLGLVHGVFRLV